MARGSYTTTDYLSVASAPATAVPITISCRATTAGGAVDKSIVCLSDTAATNYFQIRVGGTQTPSADARSTTTSTAANGPSNLSNNTWYNIVAVFASTTSRTCYLDGSAGTANTTSVTPASIDTLTVGARKLTSVTTPSDGSVAEVAIWDAVLSAHDIVGLAKGISPLLIRPDKLIFYSPLVRGDSSGNENDLVGGLLLTETGTVGIVDHPRVFYPKRRILHRLSPPVFTGSALLTTAAELMAAVASFTGTAGTYTGSLAPTAPASTTAASALFTPPVYTGSTNLTTDETVVSSAASFVAPVYTGSTTLVADEVTSSSAAVFVAPVYTGTSNLTIDEVTTSIAASFVAPVYTGSSGLTTDEVVVSTAAVVTAPVYTGSSSLTSDEVTFASAAVFTAPVYTGSSGLTTDEVTFSSASSFVAPVYVGSLTAQTAAVEFNADASSAFLFSASASLTTAGVVLEAYGKATYFVAPPLSVEIATDGLSAEIISIDDRKYNWPMAVEIFVVGIDIGSVDILSVDGYSIDVQTVSGAVEVGDF